MWPRRMLSALLLVSWSVSSTIRWVGLGLGLGMGVDDERTDACLGACGDHWLAGGLVARSLGWSMPGQVVDEENVPELVVKLLRLLSILIKPSNPTTT